MIDISMKGKDDIREKESFFATSPFKCIVCGKENYKEEIRTGRGRLDAGVLNSDLHREFLPTKDFGMVIPFLYNAVTCNFCYYSFFSFDYIKKLSKRTLEKITTDQAIEERQLLLAKLFQKIPDFSERRTMLSALASYQLVIASYNQFDQRNSPTIRLAIATLRSAWICKLLHRYKYGEEFDDLKKIFYRKASYFYSQSLVLQEKGTESLDNLPFYGPDSDKDYGFDGIVYINAWLRLYYGNELDTDQRKEDLLSVRSSLSKVFGFGKSSKEKPSVLLNQAKDTFDEVDKELKVYGL